MRMRCERGHVGGLVLLSWCRLVDPTCHRTGAGCGWGGGGRGRARGGGPLDPWPPPLLGAGIYVSVTSCTTYGSLPEDTQNTTSHVGLVAPAHLQLSLHEEHA